MITKAKYAILYILALVTGASELEKAELRVNFSLASFESVKNSLEKTADTIDQQINDVFTIRRNKKLQAKQLEEEAEQLQDVGKELSQKDSEVRSKITKIDELL